MDAETIVEKLRAIANGSTFTSDLKESILELANDLEAEMIPQEQWDAVMENAQFMLIEYKKIPTGMFGAINIANAIQRYENGERTKELYDDLESIE